MFSDFLSDGFLIFFKNIETSMELYNGEKIGSAAFIFHDLDPADGLSALNRTAVANAMYSITECKSKSVSLHKRRSPPFYVRILRNCVYHKDT